MSQRILIGHPGLRGDLAINIPAIEYLKRTYPDAQIDMPIHKRFADMLPLFVNQPSFNPVILDGYDDFPTAKDKELIESRGYTQICHPMQPHREDRWHDRMHQTAAVSFDYFGVVLEPEDQQINLHRWFDIDVPSLEFPKVAFAPFAGYETSPTNDKMLTVERAQAIVDYIMSLGYDVLHLAGPGEPCLKEFAGRMIQRTMSTYFNSVKSMLGTKLLLHTDTGMGWIASGYQHPSLGLYSNAYYGADKVNNIQPRNPNATYFDAPNVNDIPLETIFAALRTRLSL